MIDDNEDDIELPLELCVDVYDEHITINLPDIPTIEIDDEQLMFLFNKPELVLEQCGEEVGTFWNNIIPHLIRTRNNKRELYDALEIAF